MQGTVKLFASITVGLWGCVGTTTGWVTVCSRGMSVCCQIPTEVALINQAEPHWCMWTEIVACYLNINGCASMCVWCKAHGSPWSTASSAVLPLQLFVWRVFSFPVRVSLGATSLLFSQRQHFHPHYQVGSLTFNCCHDPSYLEGSWI